MSERRRKPVSASGLAVALWCLLAGGALGQGLPAAIVTKVDPMSEAEKKQIADYVAANSTHLDGADPQLLKKDREALLDPLTTKDVSAPFRIQYDHELVPKLRTMVGTSTEMVVINGLVISGELATDNGLGVIKQKLGDKSASIRFQAAYALSRTFQAAAHQQPAATKGPLDDAVGSLETQLTGEKDPLVLDALIRAGRSAADHNDLRNHAVSAVSKGMIQASKGMGNPGEMKEVEVLLRAAVDLREVAAQAVQRQTALDRPAATAAAELGGVLIAHTSKVVGNTQHPLGAGPLRDAYTQLAQAAQTLVQLSGQNLQPGGDFQIKDKDGRPIHLNDSLKLGTKAGDGSFIEDAKKIIGKEEGMLPKPPFELPADKFK